MKTTTLRALVIDDEARAEIARVVKHAADNFITKEQLLERVNHPDQSIGDDLNHVCDIQDGFRCVLSIEQQPFGWCKHLSVSIDEVEKLPNV